MESKNIVFPQRGEVALLSQPIDPPGPREIQCRAEVSLISIGTELRCLHGRPQEGTSWSGWVKYPFLPGYSMAATVVAVGADVTEYQVGDRVAAFQEHTQFFNEPVDNNKFLTGSRLKRRPGWASAAASPRPARGAASCT